jgi:xylulokinase
MPLRSSLPGPLLVAGIDASTQSCKVVVRESATGAVVRHGVAPVPGDASIDPARWWEALAAAVSAAGGLADVAAISVGAQQHGMVALDEQGRVVRDALLWHDTRSAPQAQQLTEELGPEAWISATGMTLAASFTVTKLRWLRENEPANAARVAAVALPHDWLTWRLRGFGPGNAQLRELTTDRSDASGTAYWSPYTEAYRTDIVDHAFGREVVLPRVLQPNGVAGFTADVVPGIPAGIPLGVGGADNALAALGLGIGAGDAVVSIGTSGTVYAQADTPVKDLRGVVSTYADATGKYLPLVAMLNAARVLDAGRTLLRADHATFDVLAKGAPPGSGGVTLLPYFEGERYPVLPDGRASLDGLTLGNCTPENIARAFVEGLACSLANGLDALRATGIDCRRVILIGGGSRSAATQHVVAGIFGVPVVVPTPDEYVARGAAKQAIAALGEEMPIWAWGGQIDLRPEVDMSDVRRQHRRALLAVTGLESGPDGVTPRVPVVRSRALAAGLARPSKFP